MSILSSIAGALAGTSPPNSSGGIKPAEIAQRLRAARADLAELQRQYGVACLDALDGDASERDRLADDIEAHEREVRRLELALTVAEERLAGEHRRQTSALRASRVHSATIHMRTAEKAALRLATALAEAAEARRDLLAASAKARTSAPDPLPAGTMTEAGILDKAIANEMWRVSRDMKGGHLPGAKAPTILTKDDPEAITPLAEQVRAGHDRALAMLRGDVPSDRLPTVRLDGDSAPVLEARREPRSATGRDPMEAPPEYDADALQPGIRSAEEIQAGIARVKMNLNE